MSSDDPSSKWYHHPTVDLSNRPLASDQVRYITARLRHNKVVTSVDLCETGLGPNGAAEFSEVIRANGVMKVLLLADNAILDAGTIAVARGLESNTALTHLDLRYPHQSSAHSPNTHSLPPIPISLAFRKCAHSAHPAHHPPMQGYGGTFSSKPFFLLRTLVTFPRFRNNEIGTEGVSALAAVLRVNSSLLHVDLQMNAFCSAGLQDLAASLCSNCWLQTLTLNNNALGDPSAASLADMLRSNQALRAIGLANTGITDVGAKALAKALEVWTGKGRGEGREGNIPRSFHIPHCIPWAFPAWHPEDAHRLEMCFKPLPFR